MALTASACGLPEPWLPWQSVVKSLQNLEPTEGLLCKEIVPGVLQSQNLSALGLSMGNWSTGTVLAWQPFWDGLILPELMLALVSRFP